MSEAAVRIEPLTMADVAAAVELASGNKGYRLSRAGSLILARELTLSNMGG